MKNMKYIALTLVALGAVNSVHAYKFDVINYTNDPVDVKLNIIGLNDKNQRIEAGQRAEVNSHSGCVRAFEARSVRGQKTLKFGGAGLCIGSKEIYIYPSQDGGLNLEQR